MAALLRAYLSDTGPLCAISQAMFLSRGGGTALLWYEFVLILRIDWNFVDHAINLDVDPYLPRRLQRFIDRERKLFAN